MISFPPKVCLRVGGEDELLHLAGLAKEAGLVTGVVRDAGRTQVGETNEIH